MKYQIRPGDKVVFWDDLRTVRRVNKKRRLDGV